MVVREAHGQESRLDKSPEETRKEAACRAEILRQFSETRYALPFAEVEDLVHELRAPEKF